MCVCVYVFVCMLMCVCECECVLILSYVLRSCIQQHTGETLALRGLAHVAEHPAAYEVTDGTCSAAADSADEVALRAEVAAFLTSPDLQGAIAGGLRLDAPFILLLEGILERRSLIKFAAPDADPRTKVCAVLSD